jgi:ABC-2 type transport system permease protein
MCAQICAIVWAQFRIMRNHLPRTNAGALLMWLLSLLWYGMYAAFGAAVSVTLPRVPVLVLQQWLPVGLLAVFLFWQVIPLFTLSSGWSLQLNKLQIYPVKSGALFGLEVLLCLSTAPEMILVLAGTMIGLMRHGGVPPFAPFLLLLYIPFNLFVSLAVRELLLHSFERNRFRELFAILLISLGVLPQLLLHTEAGRRVQTYLLAASKGRGTPWHEVAVLSYAPLSLLALTIALSWIAGAYAIARWQFQRSLMQEETFRDNAPVFTSAATLRTKPSLFQWFVRLPSRFFRDPTAAIVEKELRSLVRMPRFRVMFGMACIFGVLIFIPMTLRRAGTGFIASNFLPVVNVYGLLLLGDVLLWNVFGFDRGAAALYFVTPVPFDIVLKAKNVTAIIFMMLQTVAVSLVAAALQITVSPLGLVNAFAASAVVAIFFLSIGNLSSVAIPRPMNPAQTFRKQASGKMQLRLMATSVGLLLLLGFAFAARWALEANWPLQAKWALLAVLGFEFGIGFIVYRIATESAVARGTRERERILDDLSKGASPISYGGL